jgi:hypothetical protein
MKIDLNGVNVHYSTVDDDFYLSTLVSGEKNNSATISRNADHSNLQTRMATIKTHFHLNALAILWLHE